MAYSDDTVYYPGKDVTLPAILERLYGAGNLTKVDDSNDQIFVSTLNSPLTGIRAVAKYANYGHQIGYSYDSNGNGDYTDDITMLFDLPNNDYLAGRLTSNFESTASSFTQLNTAASNLVFFLDPYNSGSGAVSTVNAPMWSTLNSLNSDGANHVVTYKITGNTGYADNKIGNYVLAWEDNWAFNSVQKSDWDYNDVVMEIHDPAATVGSDTPEPATMILLGLGLAGLGILKRRASK